MRKGHRWSLIPWLEQDTMKNEELPMLISLGIREACFLILREEGWDGFDWHRKKADGA